MTVIDIVFPARNRRAFTDESLAALRDNTDWRFVRKVWFYDDGSTDGTGDLFIDAVFEIPAPAEIVKVNLNSPVDIMADYLSRTSRAPAEWFAKIDNDTVVPPGWLPACLAVLLYHPQVDLLGLEAIYAPAQAEYPQRLAEQSDHIGGIGLMRTACFEGRPLPVESGRLGFGQWQNRYPEVFKAWLRPGLPVILLDRLPFEPWASLSAQYERQGWQRPWKRYTEDDEALWAWWKR